MNYCEPYRSCSLLGVLRSFANVNGLICLIHGPSGCSFYARNSIIRLNGYYSAKERIRLPMIFCTDVDENDVIMGGIEKLRLAILELIEKYSPDALVVFNCCVTEIIGDDIDSLSEEIEKESNVKIVPVHSAGFKGDHKYGMHMAGDILVNYFFSEKAEIDYSTVNILGEYDYFNRTTKEIHEVLNRIGIKNINYIPGVSSVKELYNAPNACLNIITCQNASRHLAELMKQKYGIEYFGEKHGLYGIKNSYMTYKRIYDFFGKDDTELNEEKEKYERAVESYKTQLSGKKAFIVAGTRRTLGYSEILKELGIEISFIFTESNEEYTTKDDFLKFSKNVMCNENPERLFEKIDNENPDFVFSTLPELVAPNKYVARRDEDYAGFQGVVDMAEYLVSKLGLNDTVYTRMEN